MKCLFSLACLISICSAVYAAPPTTAPSASAPAALVFTDGPGGIEITRDMEIARVGDDQPLLVDIARPKVTKGPMPVVLCVHGGGWSGGTKAVRLDLAQRGYFVVAIAYRLAGKNLWPAQIQDCKLTVRWIRANATKYNINPDKIGVFGHSAGGHLVACLGTMTNVPGLDDGPYPGVSSAVQAVVDYAGPSDLLLFFHGKPPVNLFGPQGQVETMEKASPVHFVSSTSPPFFIAHGDHDKLVPIAQAELLYEALKKANVPVEYVIVKNGGHSLGGVKTDPPCEPTAAELKEMSAAFLDKYLKQ